MIILKIAFFSFALLAWAVTGLAAPTPTNPGFEHFITRSGNQLMEGERVWRSIGVNIPGLVFSHDGLLPSLPTPWEQEDAFKSMEQMGVNSVRIFMPSTRKPYAESELVRRHVLGPGKFDDESFRAFDKALELANRYHLRVIVTLVDTYAWCSGGFENYAAFRNKTPRSFWTDRQLIDDFKQTVRYMITRQNHYTGVVWKDDPAILCWELGNELGPNKDADYPSMDPWAAEIAAFVKSLDPHHLVMDGSMTHKIPDIRTAALDDPNIDIISPHHYVTLTGRLERNSTRGKKALIVGEFGNAPPLEIRSYLDGLIADGTSGALFWAMSFHRETGGFKKHTFNTIVTLATFTARTICWPGFDDDEFDERGTAAVLRDAAYKIRGLTVPPPVIPEAPLLLPLPTTLPWQQPGQLALFNWRGSAGASGYRLERAERRDGSYIVVGDNLPDGQVFYQTLATDNAAELNHEYFYRLRATTSSGVSAPSPIIGPVIFRERLMIDPLRDFSLMAEHSPDLEIRGDRPQLYYESYHRVHRKRTVTEPQSLTYRVKAGAVASFRVTVFGDSEPDFLSSADGVDFRPVPRLEREITPGYVSLWDGADDYIQTRTIYRPAAPMPANTQWVRMVFTSAVIGRVEIGSTP